MQAITAGISIVAALPTVGCTIPIITAEIARVARLAARTAGVALGFASIYAAVAPVVAGASVETACLGGSNASAVIAALTIVSAVRTALSGS